MKKNIESEAYWNGYNAGVEDTIADACEWMRKNLTLDGKDNETINQFRKAMEE